MSAIRNGIELNQVEVDLERGAHDCHVYRTWDERWAVVAPFVRDGLELGEHCLLVTSAQSFDRWRSDLTGFGVDVDREEQTGALAFVTGEGWRGPLSMSTPNSMTMVRNTLSTVEQLLQRYRGVRIVGDAEWDLDPPVTADALCHWEATANVVFEGSDVRAICQYDITHYEPPHLHAALRTHPSVIWDGKRRRNPFYEAPQILQHEPHLNHSASDRQVVDQILARLN